MKFEDFSKPISKISKKLVFSKKAGQPPGTLVYTGDTPEKPISIELIQYNEEQYLKKTFWEPDSFIKLINPEYVNWVHISNLSNTKLIESMGNHFNIHALTLEDVLNTGESPKIEESENQLFMTLKLVRYSDEDELIESHISLILKDHYLLTFADLQDDVFIDIKNRLESPKNRARIKKNDYLFYLILDNLVDKYYIVFDKIYSTLETIETNLIEKPDENSIGNIHRIKKDLANLRKTLVPLEKSVSFILRDEFDLIDDNNEIFIRDVYDNLVQLVQTYDSYREFTSSLIELNSSNMNNNLNQTIKILTVIATIFIPLTFIAGIYGMNFRNIPELEWQYGFYIILGVMALIATGMVFFMKKKGFF